jgi:hypothetical protein
MSAAIFIIALVGFTGRLVYSAIAIRSRVVVCVLSVAGAAIYGALLAGGVSPAEGALQLLARFGAVALLFLCAVMFGLGYGVPSLLRYAERKSRAWQGSMFLAAVLGGVLVVDLGRTIGGMPLVWSVLTPEMCFVGGVMAYLIFNARIFETDSDPEPAERRRR